MDSTHSSPRSRGAHESGPFADPGLAPDDVGAARDPWTDPASFRRDEQLRASARRFESAIEESAASGEALATTAVRLPASQAAPRPRHLTAVAPSASESLRPALIRALIVLGAILLELVLADLLRLCSAATARTTRHDPRHSWNA